MFICKILPWIIFILFGLIAVISFIVACVASYEFFEYSEDCGIFALCSIGATIIAVVIVVVCACNYHHLKFDQRYEQDRLANTYEANVEVTYVKEEDERCNTKIVHLYYFFGKKYWETELFTSNFENKYYIEYEDFRVTESTIENTSESIIESTT